MSRVSELLAELVAIPTHQAGPDGKGGNERRLCDHLAPLLRERGADEVIVGDAKRTDGSPGAYVFARWGTPRRVINAHVDTVPANAGWSRDPWKPHIEGGKLYGLGSADTKGAIAATLVALDAQRPTNAGVLFSGDEEAGSAVMHEFLKTPHATQIKEVIVCEPTARTAGIAHRGVIGQLATVTGEGGHSSKADFMPKPIAKLARLAVRIDDLGRQRLHTGPTGMRGICMNVAAIHGGVAFNVIPQRAVLEWSLRPYPGFDREAWDSSVAAAINDVDAEEWIARGLPSRPPEGERDQIALSTPIDHAPFACDKLADAVRPFVKSVGSLDFWTEAALYQAHGIDAIVIGPGDIGTAHAADEFVPLDDLDWAVDLYRSLLASA
ncbi:MAG TPA: M20/M25/M40 family metallo-hydrolase [Kofleriaceae bacterium]|nr:M20/M25/M40 family metallo-hydrolase [Kofleriaceae bacterium]